MLGRKCSLQIEWNDFEEGYDGDSLTLKPVIVIKSVGSQGMAALVFKTLCEEVWKCIADLCAKYIYTFDASKYRIKNDVSNSKEV